MDVLTLRQFYSSPLGQNVAQHISAAITRRWPDASADSLLGLGFCVPYLEALREKLPEVVAMMPAQQGAIHWPKAEASRTALVCEHALPLQEAMFNRVLCTHVLEHTQHVQATLEEVWHVLQPSGRALLVVPQRRSFWARATQTPFGFGQPFSLTQLHELVTGCGFTYIGHSSALYAPPLEWRFMLRASGWLEQLGRMVLPGYGGVIVMEVEKQLYATLKKPQRAEQRLMFAPLRVRPVTASPNIAYDRSDV